MNKQCDNCSGDAFTTEAEESSRFLIRAKKKYCILTKKKYRLCFVQSGAVF